MQTKETLEATLKKLVQETAISETTDEKALVAQLFSNFAEAALKQVEAMEDGAEIDKIEIPSVVTLGCGNKQVWVCYKVPIINKEVCIPHYEIICD